MTYEKVANITILTFVLLTTFLATLLGFVIARVRGAPPDLAAFLSALFAYFVSDQLIKHAEFFAKFAVKIAAWMCGERSKM